MCNELACNSTRNKLGIANFPRFVLFIYLMTSIKTIIVFETKDVSEQANQIKNQNLRSKL
jgi:hypothetical protein